MKRFVSVWDMRKGFTLIEVMVAVLIVSVVIMALIQMRGNSTHMFFELNKKSKINQYSSFFISNSDYGFEKKNVTMDKLIADFSVERDLRQKLKNTRVEVIYQELDSIDMREFDSNDIEDEDITDKIEKRKDVSSNLIFEIGKTILKAENSSTGLLRIKIQ